jgi:hypothetical protein
MDLAADPIVHPLRYNHNGLFIETNYMIQPTPS